MDAATTFTHPALDVAAVSVALRDAGFEVGEPEPVRRTLLDTFDGRLHEAGLRLELEEGAGGGQLGRLVLADRTGGSAPASAVVAELPRVAADLPPGPFRARLAPVLEVRALLPRLELEGRRCRATDRDADGKVRAAVVLHDGLTVVGDASVAPTSFAEVEELAGYAKAARRARELLGSLGLTPHDGDVVAVLAEAASVDLRGFQSSPTVELHADEPALEAYRRVLRNLAGTIQANRQGTIDDVDPEFLHELRVAVRRTRSVIAQGKGVLPSDVRARFRDEFRQVGAATGPARDLDVHLIEWDRYVAPLGAEAAALDPVREHLAGQRRAAYAQLGKRLRSRAVTGMLRDWTRWLDGAAADVEGVGDDAPDAARPAGEVVVARIRRADERLVEHGRRIDADSPGDELHELRKDAKKLRYLLECFGGLLEPDARKAFVKRLKALQDNLGAHQDAEVHAASLREVAHELHGTGAATADTLLAMGRLTAALDDARAAARAEFAERFAAYDAKKTRKALDALLDPLDEG